MSNWQHAGRLRRNHALAAIVALIGRIAGHRAAALHALRILSHGGQTVRKLQTQQASDCHYNEQSFPHTLIDSTLVGRERQRKDTGNLHFNLRERVNSGVQLEINGERFGAKSPILVHSWCTLACKWENLVQMTAC